jgi:hypothetical protein
MMDNAEEKLLPTEYSDPKFSTALYHSKFSLQALHSQKNGGTIF